MTIIPEITRPVSTGYSIMGLPERSYVLLAIILTPVASCTLLPESSPRQQAVLTVSSGLIGPSEIIVQFYPGTPESRIREILAEIPASLKKQLGSPLVYLVKPLDGGTVSECISRLQQYKEIQYAEPNQIHRMLDPGQSLSPDQRP